MPSITGTGPPASAFRTAVWRLGAPHGKPLPISATVKPRQEPPTADRPVETARRAASSQSSINTTSSSHWASACRTIVRIIESCLRLGIHRSSLPADFQTESANSFAQGSVASRKTNGQEVMSRRTPARVISGGPSRHCEGVDGAAVPARQAPDLHRCRERAELYPAPDSRNAAAEVRGNVADREIKGFGGHHWKGL